MSIKAKLIKELWCVNAPLWMVRLARAGVYDTAESPLPFPIRRLVSDAERAGFHRLAERARAGEFDAAPSAGNTVS